MTTLMKSALTALFILLFSTAAIAAVSPDALLAQIDKDIEAKRLSAPKGNNAMEKIFLFKSIAPYDQRVTSRVIKVGSFYVSLAQRAIEAKQYTKAQNHLDKAWMVSHLTPNLGKAQDKLDALYSGGKKAAASAPKVASAAPKAKSSSSAKTKTNKQKQAEKKAAEAKKQKALAAKQAEAKRKKALAAKKAEDKRKKQLAAQKAAEEKAKQEQLEQERIQAQLRKEAEAKAQAAAKLALLKEQRDRAQEILEQKEESPAIAKFELDQTIIDDRSTRAVREALGPICQEILDNEASVVIHTRTPQDYRWLTVRVTLCVRRIDSTFRLRHSNQLVNGSGDPQITLHPGRSISLLKQARGN